MYGNVRMELLYLGVKLWCDAHCPCKPLPKTACLGFFCALSFSALVGMLLAW